MSWDAEYRVVDPDGRYTSYQCNYTHNTNPMIRCVLDVARLREALDSPWWFLLDGRDYHDGDRFLDLVIGGLSEAPEFFRAMNPPNGWGDYDDLLLRLIAMRDFARKHPGGWWSACG